MNRYGVLCVALAVLLSGCATQREIESQKVSKSNLTAVQVSITLKKNITTQQEVVETFGAPNLVTQNADGEESWTYQKQATVSNASSSSAFATIILAGASSSSSGLLIANGLADIATNFGGRLSKATSVYNRPFNSLTSDLIAV